MIRSLLVVGLLVLTFPAVQKAQTAKPARSQGRGAVPLLDNRAAAEKTPADSGEGDGKQIVKVTTATSRPEVTTSGNFGVYADLQNMASVPMIIYPKNIRLVVQPEITTGPGCVYALDGFFPTEPNPDEALPLGGPIVIQPAEHYQAFWTPSAVDCGDVKAKGWWAAIHRFGVDTEQYALRSIGFVPGDYAFIVLGKASLLPEDKDKEKEPSAYHTFVQVTKLHVGITQLEAIVAAMFGGLLAYFVVALRQDGEFQKLKNEQEEKKRSSLWKWGVILRSLCSAALLSAVITVILSRISDTQFPVKVSVNDFWGALTIGFIAYFTGNNIINRIVGLASSPIGGTGKQSPPINPTPPVASPVPQPAAPPASD